jgi:hypothetical protein
MNVYTRPQLIERAYDYIGQAQEHLYDQSNYGGEHTNISSDEISEAAERLQIAIGFLEAALGADA